MTNQGVLSALKERLFGGFISKFRKAEVDNTHDRSATTREAVKRDRFDSQKESQQEAISIEEHPRSTRRASEEYQ